MKCQKTITGDSGVPEDLDGDGYTLEEGDCWDDPSSTPEAFLVVPSSLRDASGAPLAWHQPAAFDVHPGAKDSYYDGVDQDCAGDDDFDADKDSYRSGFFPDHSGSFGPDCDDMDPAVRPDATEACDRVDNDCDSVVDEDDATGTTLWYRDRDADSFGNGSVVSWACSAPSGYVGLAGDCDDTLESVNPDATEICNGMDDDCDGISDEDGAEGSFLWYQDLDADTYGDASEALLSCEAPSGYVADASDCDDSAATIHPGATETCNDVDDDCDGDLDEYPVCDDTICATVVVEGLVTQSSYNGTYTLDASAVSDDAPVWRMGSATLAHGIISAGYWEITATSPGRPALCEESAAAGPYGCTNWREWRGSSLGFVTVPAVFTCR